MKAVGVYISAGGFSVGVDKYFDIAAHLTDGDFGHETLEHNFPETPIHYPKDSWPVLDSIDFMYCAPPCAPFSPIGKGGDSWRTNPKVNKVRDAAKVGWKTEPTIWITESVPAFRRVGVEIVDWIKEGWLKRGYAITELWTGAILHGSPQRRIRYHLIAHKVRLSIPRPRDHGILTYQDAIEKRPPKNRDPRGSEIKGKVSWLFPYVPQGGKFRDVHQWMAGYPKDPKKRPRNTWSPGIPWRRCQWDRPTTAITGAIRQVHPEEPRVLTLGEVMSVCGFPKGFELPVSVSKGYAHLGKGLVPPVAQWLAKMAAQSIERGKPAKNKEYPAVDFRPQINAVMNSFPRIHPVPDELWNKFPEWRTEEYRRRPARIDEGS